MSVITSTAQSLTGARVLGLAPDALSRSLGRMASGLLAADGPATTDPTEANARQAQCRQAESGAADVQNGLSYAQTADGYLGDMTDIVTRMGELAGAAKTDGDAATEFSTLQQQLRAIIGGTTAQIGGTADVNDPSGAFNGAPLFGNTPGLAVATGAGPSVTLPSLNLRSGAIGALIGQDANGTFSLSAGADSMAETIASALGQLAGQRAGLGAAQVQLQTAASTLQIEASNLGAAFPPIGDAGSASAATGDIRATLLADPSLALLAHASQVPGAALKILSS